MFLATELTILNCNYVFFENLHFYILLPCVYLVPTPLVVCIVDRPRIIFHYQQDVSLQFIKIITIYRNTLVTKNVSAYNLIKEREVFVKEMETGMNNQAQVFLQKHLLLHSY